MGSNWLFRLTAPGSQSWRVDNTLLGCVGLGWGLHYLSNMLAQFCFTVCLFQLCCSLWAHQSAATLTMTRLQLAAGVSHQAILLTTLAL